MFTATLPDWETSSTKFGRQYRKWRRQAKLWTNRLESKASLLQHPLCHHQAKASIAAVMELTRLLEILHLQGPDPEAQVHTAWALHGMGRARAALPLLQGLTEDVAATYGEDAIGFAHFLWMVAEMQMATEDWSSAYHNAKSAKYVYISNLGEGSREDQKCHWMMAQAQLLLEQYAQAERLALGFADGTVPCEPTDTIYPAQALRLLAVIAATRRDFTGAADLLRQAQAAARCLEAPPVDFLPKLQVFQGILYRKLGIWDEAEPLLLGGREQLVALLSAKHLDVGRASLEMARFYVLQEDYTAAGKLFQEALEIFQRLKQARRDLAIAAFFQARLFRIQGKKEKARNAIQVGRNACRELGNPLSEWALRLRLEAIHLQLATEAFAEAFAEIQALLIEGGFALRTPQLGELKLLQGSALQALGDMPKARKALQEAVNFLAEPEDFPLLAHAYQGLAETWIAEKDFARARTCLDASMARLRNPSPDRSLLRGRHEFLHGRMAVLMGNYQRAVIYFDNGVAELRNGDQRHEHLQAECCLGKAETLIAQNDWSTAIKHLRRYTDSKALKKLQTEEHRSRVQYLFGIALFLAGNTRKSHNYVKKAVNRLESDAGARRNPELYLNACIQLAIGCKDRKRHSESIAALTTMLDRLAGHLHPYPKQLSTIHLLLGEACAGAAQVEQAVQHYRQCLALRARHIGPSTAAALQVHSLLADLYQSHAMHEEALTELLQKSVKSGFRLGSRADQELRIDIARQQCHLSRFQDALVTLTRLPPVDSTKNIDPLTVAWLMGQCHLEADHPEQAIQVWNQVTAMPSPPEGEPQRLQIRQRLAELYRQQGDLATAHLHYAAAFALRDQAGQWKDAFNDLLHATQLLHDLGRSQEYVQSLAQAQAYALAHKDDVSSVKAMKVSHALAEIRREQGRHVEALALYKAAIAWGRAQSYKKHLSVLADCQLQAAALEDPEEAEVRLAWIEKEYKKHKARADLVLARSCMALSHLFWDRGRTVAALEKAIQAVQVYDALGMPASAELVEARHSLALLQSDAVQKADAEETLEVLRHNSATALSNNFTIQNLEDHWRLLQAQKLAQQKSPGTRENVR